MEAKFSAGELASREYLTVREDFPVSRVMNLLERTGYLGGVVSDEKGRYLGVIHVREIIRLRSDPSKTKVISISKKVPLIEPSEGPYRIAKLMLENDVRILPLKGAKGIDGVIYDTDLIRAFVERKLLKGTVRDVMTREVITLEKGESIAKAISTLLKRKISHLPITDGGKVVGVVSTHDVAAKVTFPKIRISLGEVSGEKVKSLSLPVQNIMSTPVVTVDEGAPLNEGAALMLDKEVGSLIVTSGSPSRLVGILTRKDLLEYIISMRPKDRKTSYYFIGDIEPVNLKERTKVIETVENFLDKVEKRYGGADLYVHVKRMRGVKKPVILLRGRLLMIGKGSYHSEVVGYSLMDGIQLLLDALIKSVESGERSKRRKAKEGKPTLWEEI